MHLNPLLPLHLLTDNEAVVSAMLVMVEKPKDAVVLRVEVPEQLRTRLRTQAVRAGITMGELIEQLIEDPLKEVELEALESVKGR